MSLLRHDFFNLSQVSKDALDRRLSISDNYTVNEIDEVSNISEKLFNNGLEISKEQTEVFRVLAAHAHVKLHPRNITSHRKYVGPVIVGIKKALFKIVGVILKDTFNTQETFNRYMMKALAKESSSRER